MTINLKQISASMNDFAFALQLPSTGETIQGKPYTIRDEFKMAQIQNSNDRKTILSLIYDLIKEKYFSLSTKQLEDLTLVDIQYMLAQLKINSDENTLSLVVTCNNCKETFKHSLYLPETTVKNNEFKKTIKVENSKLPKPLSVTFKVRTYKNLMTHFDNNLDSENLSPEMKEQMIVDSIDLIAYGDEVGKPSDFTKEDLSLLIGSIPKKYSTEIQDFIDNPPVLSYEKEVKCTHCSQINKLGIEDFFYLFF